MQKYLQGAESIKISDELSSDIPISIRPEVVNDIEYSNEWTAHLDTLSDNFEDEPSSVACASVVTDPSCSHQLPKTFRLKEINPESVPVHQHCRNRLANIKLRSGTFHNYDILTDRSCLGENICGQCASDNERRSKTIFEVSVSQQRLDVTILSQDLYSYLEKVLQWGLGGVNKTFDGRVLLKSYTSLKTHLGQLRSSNHVAKTNQGLIEECALLTEGFLANLTAFKSFNLQELHDSDLLDDQLRKVFTQQQIECGMEALNLAFTAIDARETARLQPQTHKELSPACLSIMPELEWKIQETEMCNRSDELKRECLQIKERRLSRFSDKVDKRYLALMWYFDYLDNCNEWEHQACKWEREWMVNEMEELKWDTGEHEWMVRTWERERFRCRCFFNPAACIHHNTVLFWRTGYEHNSMYVWERKMRKWMKCERERRERLVREVEKIVWNPVIMILGMEKTQFDREMRGRIMCKWEEEEEKAAIFWRTLSFMSDRNLFHYVDAYVDDYAGWTQSKKEECEMEQLDEQVRKWIVDEMEKLGWGTEWREWMLRLWGRESVIRQRMRNLLCEIGRHEWEEKVRRWMKSEREKYGWMLCHMDKLEWDNDMRVWLMQQWERRMPVCMTMVKEIERHEWEREICKWMEHEREVREKLRRLDRRSAKDRREDARLQRFHSNFVSQYQLLKQATKHLLTELHQPAEQIQSHREAWDVAMRTMRGLSRLERPKCLMDALCFLCASRAVAETAGDDGSSYISAFNEGLEQWRSMFPEIDEVAWLMWQVTLGSIPDDQSTAEQHDAMLRLQYSVAELIETANGLFDTKKLNERDEMDEDQPFHQFTASKIPKAAPDIEVSDPPNIATEKERLDQVITRLEERTQGTASFNIVILVASIIFALVVHAMLG